MNQIKCSICFTQFSNNFYNKPLIFNTIKCKNCTKKCANCLENGGKKNCNECKKKINDKYICIDCEKKLNNENFKNCPLCRSHLETNIDNDLYLQNELRNPQATINHIIIKKKECCLKNLLKTYRKFCLNAFTCNTELSTCGFIHKICELSFLLFASFFIGYVIYLSFCAKKYTICTLCIISSCLGGLSIIVAILLCIVSEPYRMRLAIFYAVVGSGGFILSTVIDDNCNIRWKGFLMLLVAFPTWLCCGYNLKCIKFDE